MKLHIGNKNYSSWSMRPWVLMRGTGIAFEEVMVRFDSFEAGSQFRRSIDPISPTGKVPALDDNGLIIWDSLAIAEYLAERFPDKGLWPAQQRARAQARSVCAEMHSGFSALRSACPMNIEASLPEVGALALRDKPAVGRDLARINGMWGSLLTEYGGPFLFGAFGIADAFFAPVVMRLRTYALPVPLEVSAYMQRIVEQPGIRDWISGALAEQDFLDFEEPYRLGR